MSFLVSQTVVVLVDIMFGFALSSPFFQERKPARRPAGFAIRRQKCLNLSRLCGFAIRSKGVCFPFCLGITNPRVLIGRTFFYGGLQIRRDA